jgi:hypothetical protein
MFISSFTEIENYMEDKSSSEHFYCIIIQKCQHQGKLFFFVLVYSKDFDLKNLLNIVPIN